MRACERAWAIGERRYFAGALAGLARAVAARGDPEWGARLYGAVDAVLEATGANLPMTALPSFEPARAAVRAALGEAAIRGGAGRRPRAAAPGGLGRGRARGGLGVPAGRG